MSRFDRRRFLKTTGTTLVGSGLLAAGVSAQAADRQRWAFEAGAGIGSSPTVVDDTVYVGSDDGSLYAVDVATGERRWAFEAGDDVSSSPTVADGTVYVGSDDGSLYAVDASTGDQEWSLETGDDVFSSPAVADGTVYVGSHDGVLYAVDAATGAQQWTFGASSGTDSSPVVIEDTVYIGAQNLYAVDTATGMLQWQFETDEPIYSPPTVADGVVYVGSLDGALSAVDANTGEREWTFEMDTWIDSSPTVANGTVYIGSFDDSLYAVDAASGEQRWTFETGDDVFSSPTVADGTVYVGSSDDSLYAVDAASGEQRWAFETGDGIFSSPTVADGTVYVGSYDGSLYALEAETDASSEGSRVRHRTLGHHDRSLDHVAIDYSPTFPDVDEPITFDASNTYGTIEQYSWAFGDGTTATGDTVTHSYDEPDEYEVTLTVERSDGDSVSTTETVPVGQPTGTLSVSTTPSDAEVIVTDADSVLPVSIRHPIDVYPIPSLPSSATMLVDGERRETSEVERPVGEYRVVAAHDDFVEVTTETVTVESGETTTVDLSLGGFPRVGEYEPQDTTSDGLYNDFTGDGQTRHDDARIFFEHLESDTIRNNTSKFDFADNDRIGFADVVELLRRI